MIIAYFDSNNCDFALNIRPEHAAQAKHLINEGVAAWYAADDSDIEPTEHFTISDIKSFYNLGYTEPALQLLTMFNIDFSEVALSYDNEGELLTHIDEYIF